MVAKAIHSICSLGARSGYFSTCPHFFLHSSSRVYIFSLLLMALFCPALLKPQLTGLIRIKK